MPSFDLSSLVIPFVMNTISVDIFILQNDKGIFWSGDLVNFFLSVIKQKKIEYILVLGNNLCRRKNTDGRTDRKTDWAAEK